MIKYLFSFMLLLSMINVVHSQRYSRRNSNTTNPTVRRTLSQEEVLQQKLEISRQRQKLLPKNSKGKVWENQTRGNYNYTVGDYTVTFQNQKNTLKPKQFAAACSFSTAFKFHFLSECEETILIQATINDPRFLDLTAYEQSGETQDLPLKDFTQAIVNGFKDQCSELKSIRLQLNLGYKKEPYYGTLRKENNWKLEDGYEATEDYKIVLNIQSTLSSPIGIKFEGVCESNPNLHLKPFFTNDQHKTFYKKDETFFNFSRVATAVVDKYSRECANVEEITFTTDYVPTSYTCPTGKECKLVARKSNNWELEQINFELKSEESLMSSYNDIINLLANEEYDKFEEYTQFFRLFYVDYLQMYSEYCGALIKNPVTLEMVTFKDKYDENGFEISSEKMGEPSLVQIENNRVGHFQSYIQKNKTSQLSRIFRGYLTSFEKGTTDPLAGAILFQSRNRVHIKNLLQDSCDGAKIEKVYNAVQVMANRIN